MIDNLVNKICEYENGEMEHDDMLEFFQELVDTGLAWQLQGHYGRLASALIIDGQISSGTGKR